MFELFRNFGVKTMGFLQRQVQTVRLSPDDSTASYLIDKIKCGENIFIDVNDDLAYGKQIVISAGSVSRKVSRKEVLNLTESGTVSTNVYLVMVDASQSHVVVTLPCASEYSGHLSIVCVDATHGIELVAGPQNDIFDSSSISFHAKGDAFDLVTNTHTGTWIVVGRYAAQWYA